MLGLHTAQRCGAVRPATAAMDGRNVRVGQAMMLLFVSDRDALPTFGCSAAQPTADAGSGTTSMRVRLEPRSG